jgi:hypothetical protein
MGQAYAGILGCVAFFAEMARGVVHDSGLEATIPAAMIGLFGFAAVGYLCGIMAEGILRDAVQGQLAAKVAAETASKTAITIAKETVGQG